mmetsp:Transcript_21143/g.66879  ORF Transcript_21143/g.66879 Transcript_21143/m.66879 type:complete len:276 (+) Transcript_21143:452-1279(+)
MPRLPRDRCVRYCQLDSSAGHWPLEMSLVRAKLKTTPPRPSPLEKRLWANLKSCAARCLHQGLKTFSSVSCANWELGPLPEPRVQRSAEPSGEDLRRDPAGAGSGAGSGCSPSGASAGGPRRGARPPRCSGARSRDRQVRIAGAWASPPPLPAPSPSSSAGAGPSGRSATRLGSPPKCAVAQCRNNWSISSASAPALLPPAPGAVATLRLLDGADAGAACAGTGAAGSLSLPWPNTGCSPRPGPLLAAGAASAVGSCPQKSQVGGGRQLPSSAQP